MKFHQGVLDGHSDRGHFIISVQYPTAQFHPISISDDCINVGIIEIAQSNHGAPTNITNRAVLLEYWIHASCLMISRHLPIDMNAMATDSSTYEFLHTNG